ncbi:hypothetical protein [Pseudazoarcus pumilus]|uniref:hypothetical protein n=1 Tax=Pseudazoarcus pumilus TaxID=2067960 RepID=UPI0013DCC750|nr:hypothetical protein [Pseudazoarcus pumilus]
MFKLNRNRTYRYPVTVVVHEGEKEHKGQFHATFRAAGSDELRDRGEERLLDVVLVGVEGIEIDGEDGAPLAGADLLEAVKADPAVSAALIAAYHDSIVKKNRPKT